MYLVQPGTEITFTVKTQGADKHQWQVNRNAPDHVGANSFAWTVPNEKGIWEIHLKATGGGSEAHQEWVVSTLSNDEAPDIFDYFTDKKCYNRTETDPWGRKLPEWGETDDHDYIVEKNRSIVDVSCCHLERRPNVEGAVFLPSTTVYGTWKIKYRGSLHYYFVGRKDNSNRLQPQPGMYCYAHAGTGFYIGHLWIRGRTAPELFGKRFQENVKYGSYGYPRRYSFAWRRSIGEYGTFLSHVPGWVDLKIIHAPDGAFYFWINGRIMPGTFNIDNTAKLSEYLWFADQTVDSVEVYKNRYLFPEKSAVFREYQSSKTAEHEDVKKGIVMGGRGVRLSDIAEMVRNPELFQYDAATKTGVCYTNLALEGGAELLLRDETLKMHCETDGAHDIRVMEGATVNLTRATITSDGGHYYLWRFTSPYDTEYVPSGGFKAGYFDSRAILLARDSTIDNCGFLYLQAPRGVVLENTELTNLVAVPSAPCVTYNPQWPTVDAAAFWFKERMPTVPYRSFRKLRFSGHRDRTPIGVVFEGGDPFGKLSVHDSVFEHAVVEVRSHVKSFGGGVKCDWQSPTGAECFGIAESGRTLNLVNCKFTQLRPANKFCRINPMYYLDLRAVDVRGRPVPDAKVTVVNDVDDEDHPPTNLEQGWQWTCTYGEGYGGHLVPYQKWSDPKPCRSTLTGKDGHTPPPSDRAGCLLLTDCTVMNEENFDGVRLAWSTSNNKLKIGLDLYDDLKGHLLSHSRALAADVWKPGETHHARLTYKREENTLQLVVTNKGEVIWDTGKLPIFTTDRGRLVSATYDLGRVEIGIGRNRVPRGKESYVRWEKPGHISLFHSGVSSGGWLRCHVDNMKLDVEKLGLIESNDYSTAPAFSPIAGQVYGYNMTMPQAMVSYGLARSTGGRSFTWEFDNTLDDTNNKYYAAAVAWLRRPTSQARREFTYTVTVEADQGKKVITGVNPGPHWYRSDPNAPTYTITAVLDGKTETEAELQRRGLASSAPR